MLPYSFFCKVSSTISVLPSFPSENAMGFVCAMPLLSWPQVHVCWPNQFLCRLNTLRSGIPVYTCHTCGNYTVHQRCSFVVLMETIPQYTPVRSCKSLLVGGFNPSEKYESQLGLLFPIYGKIKNVPNHQPD